MDVPCARVRPAKGEATRSRLADADLIDDEYEITVEDGWLYIPVVDEKAAATALESASDRDHDIVTFDPPARHTQTTPEDVLGWEPSYERLGEAALLEEDDDERAAEIARAIVESDLPLETVLNKASKIKGETRIRDWDVLEGEGTTVVHREYGCTFELDLAAMYFSPRLATERHRVAEQVEPGERAFDMFAGVGPFVIPLAKRGAECVGVDINEAAIEYLERNATTNGVADHVTTHCADVREIAPEYEGWADRIVMNLPHSADEFLESAVTIAGDRCTLHYYDIQHEDDPFGPGEHAIQEAAAPEYDVTVETRRTVRSYAPHELNVCLDVVLERLES
ncbi:class I SAM-dependent methyltransferase family protein [Halobacteria archaeon AArc-curdl1]|uniref:Class I SAM-dependent methyltransferase family protein n=1 Tax=Natronosalvus hydrolyticus TaxID=2979988 RepID=A0AAP2Z973_9EURY|nr:class I SAM-dependent methyltransferase family protein [Halobacteria archaeon AArc-curdl1]